LITSGYTGIFNHGQTIVANGNVTLGANFVQAGTGQLTVAGNATLTSNGVIWTGILALITTNGIKTLADDWEINGLLNVANTAVMNGFSMKANGVTMTSALTGSTHVILKGGIWSGTLAISNNLTFDGNVTISGIVTYNTGTFKYLSGSITVTGSTFQINGSCTIDATGMTFDRVIPILTATITLLSKLDSNRIESNLGNTTFAGAYGWECNLLNWTFTTGSTTIFQEGIEYKINTQFTCNQTRIGATVTFRSSSGTNKAIITLKNGAICSVLANFTRIDASGGRTITTFIGTVTDCINIIRYDGNLPDNALTF